MHKVFINSLGQMLRYDIALNFYDERMLPLGVGHHTVSRPNVSKDFNKHLGQG